MSTVSAVPSNAITLRTGGQDVAVAMPAVRHLECFEIFPDRFVGRVKLALTLKESQELFGTEPEAAMYDSWEVKPVHVEYMQACTGIVLDPDRFAYLSAPNKSEPLPSIRCPCCHER